MVWRAPTVMAQRVSVVKHRLPVVDLGCGRRKVAGSIGLDVIALPGVEVMATLNSLPFKERSLGGLYALNVLEHVNDLPGVMAEVWRVLGDGHWCRVEVPYFTSVSAFSDPTHCRWFTYSTFEHFGPAAAAGWQENRHTWFGGARFAISRRRLIFGRAHQLLGIAWFANRFPAVYENLFAYWFPARALEVELRRIAAA